MYRLILLLFVVIFFNHLALAKEKSFYCIQVLTTTELTKSELKLYNYMSKLFPSVRIEKIGKFYTLRVGFWRDINQAKLALKKFYKLGMNEVLLRKCYLIPRRWIYPQRNSNVKRVHFKKENNRAFKKQNYSALIRQIWNNIKFKENFSYEEFNFPTTRIGSKKKFFDYVLMISANKDFKRFYNYQFMGFNGRIYLGIYSINGMIKPYLALDNIYKKLQLNDFLHLNIGIKHRKTDIEDWYPMIFEMGTNFVDKNASLLVAYVPFRNHNNEVNLKNLTYFNLSLMYLIRRNLKLTIKNGYVDFLNRRKEEFYEGNFWEILLESPKSLYSLLLGKHGFDYSFAQNYTKYSIQISYNKNLKAFPMRYGKVYTTQNVNFPFIISDFNLLKTFLCFKERKFALSIGSYYATDIKKPIFIGLDKYKVNSRFLGLSLSVYFKKAFKYFDMYGAVFLPSRAFKDKSVKFAGGINYQKTW
ncbi:hypothetical protein [Thermovibrio sp.]